MKPLILGPGNSGRTGPLYMHRPWYRDVVRPSLFRDTADYFTAVHLTHRHIEEILYHRITRDEQ